MSTPTLDPARARDPLALPVSAVSAALLSRPLPPASSGDGSGLADLLTRLGLAGLVVAEETAARGSPVHDDLRRRTTPEAFRTSLTLDAGVRAVELLRRAGIDALLFKGAGLHRAGIYGEPRARPLSDADLLVRPGEAEAAVRLLEVEGFRPWEPWTGRHPAWVSAFALDDGAAPAGVPVTVDLHWATDYTRLRHAPGWRGDVLWDGCAPPLPAPEPHFVLTAEHLLKHLRVTVHLPAVADLVRLLPRLEEPGRVVEHAGTRGSVAGLRAVVGLLLELRAPVPEALSVGVGGPGRASAAARRARLSLPALLARHPALRGRRSATSLRDWLAPTGALGAAREVARVLLPPADWLRARYPRGGGARSRRRRYLGDLVRWAASRGASPLSPNQDLR